MPADTPPPVAQRAGPDPSTEEIDLGRIPPADALTGPLSLHGARVRRTEAVTLGDFRILGRIGTGTQGAVYRAHQISHNRPVALKVLAGDAGRRAALVARFAREAEVLARLDHPGVVRCYGVGEERGFHYFAMEYVDGADADAVLRRVGGPLPPAAALHVARRCAEALGHAAARGVTHRDVKPGNVLVGRRGAVKLTDWGLATSPDGDHVLTGTHTGMGTLRYVAPEQARSARRADRRSDVYALGGVLYELLTGRAPFPADNWLNVLSAKEAGAFPPAGAVNPAVPRRCDAVLARMLAPDPADRYPDYDELIADLVGGAGAAVPAALDAPVDGRADPSAAGRRLRVLLIYDEVDYVPLVQHALHAADVPHELIVVEDGPSARFPVGASSAPDVVILGLTSPTRASLRVLTEVRKGRRGLLACGVSKSPDGADLLRSLDLTAALWVTGFGDLSLLTEAFRERNAQAEHAGA